MNESDIIRLYCEYGNIGARDLFELGNVFEIAYQELRLCGKSKGFGSVYSDMAEIGNKRICESGKSLNEVYEAIYTVRTFPSELRATMLICLASAIELSRTDSAYAVRFDFENRDDMEYFLKYSESIGDVLRRNAEWNISYLCKISANLK